MVTAPQKIPAGYKETEIGVIPADWDIKRLVELTRVETGGTPPTKDKSNYGDEYFFVGPADLGKSVFISDTEKKLSEKGFNLSRRFPTNSILFTCIGSTIGKMGIASKELTSNQQINAVFPSELFSHVYAYYILSYLSSRIKSLAGEQAVPQINKTQFQNTQIPIPSTKTEQTAIATAISDIDALVEKLEKFITKKRAIKQGMMQELLAGKRRLPEFSGKWEKKKLGEISEITKGQGLSKGKLCQSGKNFCILYGELFTMYREEIASVYSRTDYDEGRVSRCGDVLLPGSTTTIGIDLAKASSLLVNNTLLGGDIIIIRQLDNTYNPTFLAYCLTYIYRNDIAQLAKGITIYHLHGKDLCNLAVKMPKVDEQTAIAQVLSDMDSEIDLLEQKLGKYRMVKQGMMQILLTGKVRLI